jgi:hypothetical protein
LPIFERLAKFQNKIAKLQKESEEIKVRAKIDEVGMILKKADDVSSDSEASDQEVDIQIKDVKDLMLLRSNLKKDGQEKSGKGYYKRYKEERNKYLMKGKKLKIKITHQISKMNAKGRLSNFELWVPLDSTKEDSRVLSLSLSSHVGFKGSNITRHKINEITNEIIESVVQKDQQDANVVLTQLSISMINRHLLRIQSDLTSEKILLPSRIGLSYDKFLSASNDSDVTNIEVNIEPIDMKVGFRELNNFQELGQVMSDFSVRVTDAMKTEETKDSGIHAPNYEQQKSRRELDLREQEMINSLEKSVQADLKSRVSIRDRKTKQFIKMNVKLISESINFSLMDDTGLYEYPLINFNISKIMASVETETGEDDAVNFILKKMGISKHPNLKLDACLLMESNYFNIDSGSYEPLIEPWMFSAIVLQKTKNSGMDVKLSSEEMLNINLTYGMALAVMQIMKKLNQSAGEWEDEQKNEETKQRTLSQKKSRSNTKGSKRKTIRLGEEDEEAIGFYFENYLGLSLRITLENHDTWKEQGIELSEEEEETAVIAFQDWEESGERNFRNLRELNSINKQVKKIQNGGKVVENFEDNIIRYDLYIEGFEPITGVPIEISGRRSYEL